MNMNADKDLINYKQLQREFVKVLEEKEKLEESNSELSKLIEELEMKYYNLLIIHNSNNEKEILKEEVKRLKAENNKLKANAYEDYISEIQELL